MVDLHSDCRGALLGCQPKVSSCRAPEYHLYMSRQCPVPPVENPQIPLGALSFDGFRAWAQSDSFPDTGRIDFLSGEIEMALSPEDLRTHSLVKTAHTLGLGNLLTERRLGWLFIDRTRLTAPAAKLSVEPDLIVVLRDSIQEGRVSLHLAEIEGAADLVVEIASNSSVSKDTKLLPRLYARAGILELWITDARGSDLRFQIHTLREGSYVPIEPDADGWMQSPRLGVAFRLVRQASPFTTWEYTLERRG
jgi:Uma2 family endonuclease